MEILTPGRLPPNPNEDYRGTCSICRCQVKCKPTDPAVLPYSRSNSIFKVKCPTKGCDGFIVLTEYVTRADSFVVRSSERKE